MTEVVWEVLKDRQPNNDFERAFQIFMRVSERIETLKDFIISIIGFDMESFEDIIKIEDERTYVTVTIDGFDYPIWIFSEGGARQYIRDGIESEPTRYVIEDNVENYLYDRINVVNGDMTCWDWIVNDIDDNAKETLERYSDKDSYIDYLIDNKTFDIDDALVEDYEDEILNYIDEIPKRVKYLKSLDIDETDKLRIFITVGYDNEDSDIFENVETYLESILTEDEDYYNDDGNTITEEYIKETFHPNMDTKTKENFINNYVDFDKVVEACEQDGWGHNLNRYDGTAEEIMIDNELYIYFDER